MLEVLGDGNGEVITEWRWIVMEGKMPKPPPELSGARLHLLEKENE